MQGLGELGGVVFEDGDGGGAGGLFVEDWRGGVAERREEIGEACWGGGDEIGGGDGGV